MLRIIRAAWILLIITAGNIGIGSVEAGKATVDGAIEIALGTDNQGPWHEPKTEFDNLLHSPNATGSFPISGPNISAPYSPSAKPEGWSWFIAVVADIPIENSSVAGQNESENTFYTGGKMILNAPPSHSQNLTVDDDWEICISRWQLDGAAYPSKLRSDNGSCLSVLTNQCIDDIKVAANTGRCSCPLSREIPSCASLGDDSALWDSNCITNFYNASATRAWKGGNLELGTYGGATSHDHGDVEAYNYIGSLAWPVLVSFRGGQNGGVDQDTAIDQATASMSCIRAIDGIGGSSAPTGHDLPGSGNRINMDWFALGSVLVSCILML